MHRQVRTYNTLRTYDANGMSPSLRCKPHVSTAQWPRRSAAHSQQKRGRRRPRPCCAAAVAAPGQPVSAWLEAGGVSLEALQQECSQDGTLWSSAARPINTQEVSTHWPSRRGEGVVCPACPDSPSSIPIFSQGKRFCIAQPLSQCPAGPAWTGCSICSCTVRFLRYAMVTYGIRSHMIGVFHSPALRLGVRSEFAATCDVVGTRSRWCCASRGTCASLRRMSPQRRRWGS